MVRGEITTADGAVGIEGTGADVEEEDGVDGVGVGEAAAAHEEGMVGGIVS